jgi:fibronectin type 3 domain-containing protein
MTYSRLRFRAFAIMALVALCAVPVHAQVPSAPTELSVGPEPVPGPVILFWNPAAGATSYDVFRGLTPGGEASIPFATGITSTSYTDVEVNNAYSYYYTVAGVNATGTSAPSNEVQAYFSVLPPNLTSTAGDFGVVLNWNTVNGATSYSVYRGTTSGGESAAPIASMAAALPSQATYTDTNVTNGDTYFYTVVAASPYTTSPASDEVSATPGPTVPAGVAAAGLTATTGDGQVMMDWSAVFQATSYRIFRSTTGFASVVPIASVTATNYTDTGLTDGIAYYYLIASVNAVGTCPTADYDGFQTTPTAVVDVAFPPGLQMFSLPCAYTSTSSLDTLFGYTAIVAFWNPQSDSYTSGYPIPIQLGQGYWARFPQPVTVTTPGITAPLGQPYDIPLSAGWNMVGDPFRISYVPVTALTFNRGTETFAQATGGASPLIGVDIWSYSQSGNNYIEATSIAPDQGYWIFAYANTDVEMPAP